MEQTSALSNVSITDLLDAKEQRTQRQQAWMTLWQAPLISLTLVTPGSVKNSVRYRYNMTQALQACDQLLWLKDWHILEREVFWLETGPEAFWSVSQPATLLKTALVELEEKHPLGRLWDMDVIAPQTGALSRKDCGFAPRRCLLCEQDAHACSRSRRHPLGELVAQIEQTIDNWLHRD